MQAFETRHETGDPLSMHRHRHPYLALVLDGDYEERSVDGRYCLKPGTLIYHPPFHAHTNAFLSDQVRVLNIELMAQLKHLDRYCATLVDQAGDMGAFEKLMRDEPKEALGTASEIFCAGSNEAELQPDWLCQLANILKENTETHSIGALARRFGVTPEHLSRRFRREFGIGPSTFRREQRLRRAVAALENGTPLASAAALSGFADQSHMGRVLKSAFGITPKTLHK